jgi:hypothetical protein
MPAVLLRLEDMMFIQKQIRMTKVFKNQVIINTHMVTAIYNSVTSNTIDIR